MILNQKDIFRDISAFRMQQFLHMLTDKWANLNHQQEKKQQMYATLREIHHCADNQADSEQLRNLLKKLEGFLHDSTLDLENQDPELLQSVLRQIEHLTQVVDQRLSSGAEAQKSAGAAKSKESSQKKAAHAQSSRKKKSATRSQSPRKSKTHTKSSAGSTASVKDNGQASSSSAPSQESSEERELRERMERISELERKYEELKKD